MSPRMVRAQFQGLIQYSFGLFQLPQLFLKPQQDYLMPPDFEDQSLWLSGNFEWHWKTLSYYSIPRQYCYRVLLNLVSGKQPSGILQ